jgi:hypothetical protein
MLTLTADDAPTDAVAGNTSASTVNVENLYPKKIQKKVEAY